MDFFCLVVTPMYEYDKEKDLKSVKTKRKFENKFREKR